MSSLLAPVKEKGKVISSGFVSIPHLPGSKMTDQYDKMLDLNLVDRFINPDYHNPYNKEVINVYITEKVDGSCDGVYKHPETGLLYPINRKGFDVRSYYSRYDGLESLLSFAKYVEDNAELFNSMLNPGEILCGEWMHKRHTLGYHLKKDPFIAFDVITGSDAKNIEKFHLKYTDFLDRVNYYGIEHTTCISSRAMDPKDAYKLLLPTNGYHGCLEEPEGVVYRLEINGKFASFAKYVANNKLGTEESFKLIQANLVNTWDGSFRA